MGVSGQGCGRRFYFVGPLVGGDFSEPASAEGASIFSLSVFKIYLGPLANASEAEEVGASVDFGLGRWDGTFAILSSQMVHMFLSP